MAVRALVVFVLYTSSNDGFIHPDAGNADVT
jgi:hypothetical protein